MSAAELRAVGRHAGVDEDGLPLLVVSVERGPERIAGSDVVALDFLPDGLLVDSMLAAQGFARVGSWDEEAGAVSCAVEPVRGYVCPEWCRSGHREADVVTNTGNGYEYTVAHERLIGEIAPPRGSAGSGPCSVLVVRDDEIQAGVSSPGSMRVSVVMSDGSALELDEDGAGAAVQVLAAAAGFLAGRGEVPA